MKANDELLKEFLEAGSSIYVRAANYVDALGDIRVLKNGKDIFFASAFPEDQHHCHVLRGVDGFNLVNSRTLEFTAKIYSGDTLVRLVKVEKEEEDPIFDIVTEWFAVLKDTKKGEDYKAFLDREFVLHNGDFS